MVVCHLALGVIHTRNRHSTLGIIVIDDVDIRIAVLIGRCNRDRGRYVLLLIVLEILFLVQRNQTAISWLDLISILILTKFAELVLLTWMKGINLSLKLVIFIGKISELLEWA